MASETKPLRIIPLGGVGEIGKNMYVFEYGDDIVVIDCGLMFPDEEMFGIDLVIPDITYLKERRANVRAFLITHAHEDHVGGLPYILPEFPGVPVYASTLARGLLGNKIKEHRLHNNELRPLNPGDELQIGPFTVIPFRIGHSIPDAMGIALRTPVGVVVHTGDFKFDHTPVDGKLSDFHILARLGEEGVICLLSDSTRAENPGYTPVRANRRRGLPRDHGAARRPGDRGDLRQQHRPRPAGPRRRCLVRTQDGRDRALDGAELPDRDRPGLPQVRPGDDRGQGPDQRGRQLEAGDRHDRRPGRADGRPGPDGEPRSPLRRDPAGRHRDRQRQPDPGQRGIRQPDDRQPVQGRRERLLPHDQAGPRLGPRQPGRAQADARPDQAASTSSRSTASSGCRSSTAGWPSRPESSRATCSSSRTGCRSRSSTTARPIAASPSRPATSSSTGCRSARSARSSCATGRRWPTTACS